MNKVDHKKVNKQRYKLVFYHLLTYLMIFILLGIFATILINIFFFKDVARDLRTYSILIQENIEEKKLENDNIVISIGSSNSARISTIFYNEKNEVVAYDSDILSYLIEDFEQLTNMIYRDIFRFDEQYAKYVDKINIALENDLFKRVPGILSEYTIETTNVTNLYHFQTLSFNIDNPNAPNIKGCKLLVMINGEISSRNEIMNIYLISASLMFFFAVIASLLLSSWSIKPLKQSLEKQINFVSDASHELRTPLAIVQSKLENVLTKSNQSVYDVSSDIVVALKEISRLSKLTKDLLTLAQSDHENLEMIFEDINIYELVKDVATPFMEIAQIQNKTFSISGDTNIVINADKSKIIQTLIIILDNALKYTSETESIKIHISQNNSLCFITISDTGVGISSETKKHIFERFYRADKARSRETGGNGLGLAIAKTIINQHKGEIIVSDNYPKGTKFIINLPKK